MKKLNKSKVNNIMNCEQEDKDPRTFNEAIRSSDAKEWKEAMDAEKKHWKTMAHGWK